MTLPIRVSESISPNTPETSIPSFTSFSALVALSKFVAIRANVIDL